MATPTPVTPASSGHPRTLWWVLGGASCLIVLIAGACMSIGALTLLGQRVSDDTLLVATAPVGGGLAPDEPAQAGGAVLLADDFSDPGLSRLDASEDRVSRSAYQDGAYVLEVKESMTLVWALVGGSYKDVSIEVKADVAPGSDVAAAGLVFNYQDDDNFYLYSVSNDGYYALEVLEGGEWTTLIDPTLSAQIDGAQNTLRVETRGERIAVYVNGTLLEETVDNTFLAGEAGLAVSTFEESTGTVSFDNLVITSNQ